jgi:hypothetical protein
VQELELQQGGRSVAHGLALTRRCTPNPLQVPQQYPPEVMEVYTSRGRVEAAVLGNKA